VNSTIQFFSEEVTFILRKKIKIRTWITNVIREENHTLLNINYIFCSDNYLFDLNKKYLHHNTLTDIITFPELTDAGKVSGDIYISAERIKENAGKYLQSFDKELQRVMVHGVLHLLGYKDKTRKDKILMTLKEDYYLNKI
jgi:probable rRNA maturation factor